MRALALMLVLVVAGCASNVERWSGAYDPANAYAAFDFYSKKGDDRLARPVVFVLHGGALQGGSKRDGDIVRLSEKLAARGWVAVSLDYRIAPSATWPAMLEDVRTALAYFRQNAAFFRLDPTRFSSVGFSAGGQLSLFLAFEGRVRAAGSFAGPTDYVRYTEVLDGEGIMAKALGHPAPFTEAELRATSPLYSARAGVPVFIFHAVYDNAVSVAQSDRLAEALSRAGADFTFHRPPEFVHGGVDEHGGEFLAWLARLDNPN